VRVEIADAPSRTYLQRLAECFPAWEGSRATSWYLRRPLGGPASQFLAVRQGRRMLAGVAVLYRHMLLANDAPVLVAMMSAGWTLPEVRRRGLLSRLAGEVPILAGSRGAALVVAFTTRENPSRGALEGMGYASWPTRYLLGERTPGAAGGGVRWRATQAAASRIEALRGLYARQGEGGLRPSYPESRWFADQFLDRPGSCSLLRLESSVWEAPAWAVVEAAPDTDRLQLLLAPPRARRACVAAMLRRAVARRRRFFAFHSGQGMDAAWRTLGLTVLPGRVMVAPADAARLAAAVGVTGAPPSATALVSRGSPWYLGPWKLECGDRL
jgi:hypothetical protein